MQTIQSSIFGIRGFSTVGASQHLFVSLAPVPGARTGLSRTRFWAVMSLAVLLGLTFVEVAVANVLVNQDPPGAMQNSPSITREALSGNLVVAYTSSPFVANGIGASYSAGGVGPWTQSVLQPPAGGWLGTELDASVAADGAGLTYAGLASYDQLAPAGARSAIYVHASLDGGANFGIPAPVSLQAGVPGTIPFEIKPKVETNDFPGSPFHRRVYCAWERDLTDWIHSDARFSFAPPGGAAWSPSVAVNDQPGSDLVLWPDPAVGPNGDVFVAWLDTPFWAQQQGFQGVIRVDRSVNGGAAFGPDRRAVTFWTVPTTLADAWGQPSYTAMSYPSVEVDPMNPLRVGVAYAARPGSGPLNNDARLDTGDQPPGSSDVGRYSSFYGGTRIDATNGWVYTVWEDNRNGIWDVYFKRTLSTMPTWPGMETLLSTQPGGQHPGSYYPVLASDGSDVWVAWMELGGSNSIFVNRSTDNGQSWLATPRPLDSQPSQQGAGPVITASGSNVCVAWEAVVNPGIRHDIRVNRSTDRGQTWLASEVLLTTNVMATQHDIVAAGSNVYAVWAQSAPGGSSQIWFRASGNAGQTWSAPVRLDSAPPGSGTLWSPKISCSGASVYVAWHDQRATGGVTNDIYFTYSFNAGATWSPDIPITAPGGSNNWYFHMASSGSSVFIVYESNRNNIPGGIDDVYLNSSFNGGLSWNGEVRLNGGTAPGTRQTASPRVSVSAANVYVVWQDDRNGAPFSGWDVYGTHSSNGGVTWPNADYRIDLGDTPGANTSEYPDVASDGTGAFYAWRDLRNGLGDVYANTFRLGTDEADVFYIESLDSGVTWSQPLRVNDDNTPNDQTHPWLDFKPNGTVDVVWYDKRNDPADRAPDVYFAALLPGTATFTPNIRVTTQAIVPAVNNWLGDYNWIDVDAPIAHMVWTDTRRDPWGDIYYDNRPNPVVRAHWGDHNMGDFTMTVTDQGILGFMDGTQAEGSGFVYPQAGQNQLYLGSLWLSDASGYVANRDYDADPNREWVVSTNPDGRILFEEEGESDQDILAGFTDDGAALPRGLQVIQESWAFAGPPEAAQSSIVRYSVTNTGPAPLEDVVVGLFLDLDLEGNPYDDEGATQEGSSLVYMRDPSGIHAGITVLHPEGQPWPVANLTLIHNPTFVWPNQYMLDADKWGFLRASAPQYVVGSSFEPNDWGILASVGPITLNPGEAREIAFAVLGAQNGSELERAAAVAQRIYTGGITGAPEPPGSSYTTTRLLPNVPNPFSSSTDVRFELPGRQGVTVDIYDVSGRRVRQLLTGFLSAGPHAAIWDGKDARGRRLPAGLYYLRLVTEAGSSSRPVVLLK